MQDIPALVNVAPWSTMMADAQCHRDMTVFGAKVKTAIRDHGETQSGELLSQRDLLKP